MHNTLLSQLIAGFGLFVGSLVVLTILTGIVARMVRATGLSPVDRTLGFIFGLARGAFLVCLAYLLARCQRRRRATGRRGSARRKVEPYIHEGADVMRGFLPESLKIKGAAAAEELIRTIDPEGAAGSGGGQGDARPSNPTANPAAPPAAGTAPKPDLAPGAAAVPSPIGAGYGSFAQARSGAGPELPASRAARDWTG